MIRTEPSGPEDFRPDLDLKLRQPCEAEKRKPGNPDADGLMEIAVTRRRMGRGRLLVTSVLCIALLYVAVAFVSFARDIADIHVPTDPKADAIVVLTGGKERIEQAMRLLEEGRAERLLISGVHPGSSARQIARATSTDLPLFACCVDLDRAALNTFGNAAETAAWVARHDFKTLMVVTSAYHVPRAELELADTLPNVNLVLYPVFSSERDLSEWYANFDTMKLLMREYVKYTLARLRIAVDRWSI